MALLTAAGAAHETGDHAGWAGVGEVGHEICRDHCPRPHEFVTRENHRGRIRSAQLRHRGANADERRSTGDQAERRDDLASGRTIRPGEEVTTQRRNVALVAEQQRQIAPGDIAHLGARARALHR